MQKYLHQPHTRMSLLVAIAQFDSESLFRSTQDSGLGDLGPEGIITFVGIMSAANSAMSYICPNSSFHEVFIPHTRNGYSSLPVHFILTALFPTSFYNHSLVLL
jgi:hypothetical protein